MISIRISNVRSVSDVDMLKRQPQVLRSTVTGCNPRGRCAVSELETNINRILEEHQHESGLHVIGGRRRLIDRLLEFFEQDSKPSANEVRLSRERQN
jgi:hypothetical protein